LLENIAAKLARDENGQIITDYEGRAEVSERDFAYQTTTILDDLGNEQLALAVQEYYLDDDYDSFGGNILTTGSLELLFPIPFVPNQNQIRSAFFIDVGNVFSSNCTETQQRLRNCSDFDVAELRAAAGVGITYLSPFGPLTFYVAAPLRKGENDDVKLFDFTVGTAF
jgi:outer membrane protein insertion porin family